MGHECAFNCLSLSLFQVKALIDRKNKPKKFSKLFTDNALRMYNWTGKNKRAISTSEIFKLIKGKAVAGDMRLSTHIKSSSVSHP